MAADGLKLNEIFRENHIEQPVEQHTDFLFNTRQLAEIDRPPQGPGNHAREIEAQNSGHACASPDGREETDGLEPKRLLRRPAKGRRDIAGRHLQLRASHVVPSAGGIPGQRSGTNAQSPNAQTPGQSGTSRDSFTSRRPPFVLQGSVAKKDWGSPGRPDQRVGRMIGSIAEADFVIRHFGNFDSRPDFNSALRQFFVRVTAQLLAEFRQNHLRRNARAPDAACRAEVRIERHRLPEKIVHPGNRFHTGKPAACDDESQEHLPLRGRTFEVGFFR